MTKDSDIFAAQPHVVACELEGGAALLDLQSSTYFSVNAVGAALWEALQTPASLDSLSQMVAGRFEVTAQTCRGDVARYIEQMTTLCLVSRSDG